MRLKLTVYVFVLLLLNGVLYSFIGLGYHVSLAHPEHSDSMDLSPIIIYKDTDSCNIGEVCMYKVSKRVQEEYGFGVITHRVMSFDGEFYVFKGDNNVFSEQVHKSRIVGKVFLV